jgi:hypothetical protein
MRFWNEIGGSKKAVLVKNSLFNVEDFLLIKNIPCG